MYWISRFLDPVTLTYISRSSDFYTSYVDIPLSLGCIIRKVSAEDIAIRGNGTGLEYMCPTRHFVYIFFNPVFQLSTAKNEINLFYNHILNCGSCDFCPSRCDDALRGILVLCHINDLPGAVKSTVRLFADDCLLYRSIKNMEGPLSLQRDL